MGKANLLSTVVSILGKNAGVALVDTISLGMGGAIKDSVAEIKEYTQQTNDALYYMQVKTFLETAELDQEEVDQFFENNPDHQRLGAEIFKILEQTHIDEQSQMMARGFSLYVQGKIQRRKLDQLLHIITSLNQHLLNKLKEHLPEDAIINRRFDRDYSIFENSNSEKTGQIPREEVAYSRKIFTFLSGRRRNVPQEFINFEFYEACEIPNLAGATIQEQEYRPTRDFLWFVTHIFKDNN